MICKNCGAQIPDGSAFCTECGTRIQEEPAVQEPVQEEPAVQEPVQEEPAVQEPVQPEYVPYEQPVVTDAAQNTTPILILGILAVALNSIPYVGWIGGIICAILCSKKVKEYLAAGGALAGKAKVGKILGTVGLILSIVSAVAWGLAVIASIASAILKALTAASGIGSN